MSMPGAASAMDPQIKSGGDNFFVVRARRYFHSFVIAGLDPAIHG